MKYIPSSLTRVVAKAALRAKIKSPTILFVGGTAGVITSTVLACKATMNLESILEDAGILIREIKESDDYETEKDRAHDLTLAMLKTSGRIAKVYGPSFVLGVCSIGALAGSHHILSQRNLALTAAYAALDRSYQKYRDRISEAVGPDLEKDYYRNIGPVEKVDSDGKVKKTNAWRGGIMPYATFWGRDTSDLWSNPVTNPAYNRNTLRTAQLYANDKLRAMGYLFLNDVLKSLGLEETPESRVVGWVLGNGDDYVDFGVFENVQSGERFVEGDEDGVWLDFNVDGNILEIFENARA